jgi:hypothetical protein
MMDDVLRLNLEGCDKAFIQEALTGFIEGAFFKGVLVRLWDTGFDETVEAEFGPMPRPH